MTVKDKYIPKPSLRRFPSYFAYLTEKRQAGWEWISSAIIAEDLGLHSVQVRKDLALTSVVGRPRIGFKIDDLLNDFRRLLDYENVKPAIIIGTGHLGSALLAYNGFEDFGLQLVAACDSDVSRQGDVVNGVTIMPIEKMGELIRESNIQIGVVCVPRDAAQEVCDALIKEGILAIWNFAPQHIQVPDDIVLQNENIAASLSILSKRLNDRLTGGA